MDELMRRIKAALDAFGAPTAPDTQMRRPTEAEWSGWDTALDARVTRASGPSSFDDVRQLIRYRNPVRWHNLQKDFKWVQKQMVRMGLNPEDARYIL